ncbi:MAG TPA: hypothetical protein VHK70_08155 [Burkholderiaceae bacterium]|nr:hypothetical protein [Burkholderiaceae bacterium]
MATSDQVRRIGVFLTATGVGMMSFALFLHPASPGDFVARVLFAPHASLLSSYGIQAVILFWISLALLAAGLVAMFMHSLLRRSMAWISGLRRRRRANDIENVEDLWSYM